MILTLTEIQHLLETRGHQPYEMEAISQSDHALQCAYLAELAGESTETIAACLLHDLGHLLAADQEAQRDKPLQADDLHQEIALPFMRGLFPDAVLEPIRLHVQAKRYLCLIEPSYPTQLSPASQQSLQRQGGIFSEAQAEQFIAQPFAIEAVRLRRYDDLAKVKGKRVPELSHFMPYLELACL